MKFFLNLFIYLNDYLSSKIKRQTPFQKNNIQETFNNPYTF
jgi:hypothetical protein